MSHLQSYIFQTIQSLAADKRPSAHQTLAHITNLVNDPKWSLMLDELQGETHEKLFTHCQTKLDDEEIEKLRVLVVKKGAQLPFELFHMFVSYLDKLLTESKVTQVLSCQDLASSFDVHSPNWTITDATRMAEWVTGFDLLRKWDTCLQFMQSLNELKAEAGLENHISVFNQQLTELIQSGYTPPDEFLGLLITEISHYFLRKARLADLQVYLTSLSILGSSAGERSRLYLAICTGYLHLYMQMTSVNLFWEDGTTISFCLYHQ